MGRSGFVWRIAFADVTRAQAPFLDAVLEPMCDAVTTHMEENAAVGSVEGFAELEPDRARLKAAIAVALSDDPQPLPQPKIDLVPPKDWVAENLHAFEPIRIGRFFIHGSHHEARPPLGTIPLKLDAGTAFGSGEHPSTAGCLTVLDAMARQGGIVRPLDVGCGSGILSLAIAKLWRVPVIASDIDPESARVTKRNARENGVGHLVHTAAAAGYSARLVRDNAPYDLIVANILARPLRRMAVDLARHLAPGGTAILSGLLMRDGPFVITAQRHAGLTLERHLDRNGWRTLVFRKP